MRRNAPSSRYDDTYGRIGGTARHHFPYGSAHVWLAYFGAAYGRMQPVGWRRKLPGAKPSRRRIKAARGRRARRLRGPPHSFDVA